MRHKKLGRTGLLVSELALGTNTFGGGDLAFWKTMGGLDQAAVNSIVKRAVESGINFFDTADTYSAGQSEERVGQAIRDLKLDRGQVVIATKTAGRTSPGVNDIGASRHYLMNAVEKCLRRLQTDYIDVYMVHHYDPVTPMEETLRALDDLVRSGKVRYVGCSNYSAWQAMKGIGISERQGLERFEIIEYQWSAATRDIEREIIALALDQKIGVMAWGALLGGLLSGKYKRDGSGESGGRTGGSVPPVLDKDRVFDVVDALAAVAARHGATPGQVALSWLLHQPGLSTALFGVRSVEQLDANLKAADIRLTADDLKQIDEANPVTPGYGMWVVRGVQQDRLKYV